MGVAERLCMGGGVGTVPFLSPIGSLAPRWAWVQVGFSIWSGTCGTPQ